jgi:hypothetical protein
MGDPDCARMRWANPGALHPNVAVAVPAVITISPDPSVMRWTIMHFYDRLGRRDTNEHLSKSGRGEQSDTQQ